VSGLLAPGGDGVLRTAGSMHPVTPGVLDATHDVILYLEDVTVSFAGFRALDRLTLYVGIGELRAIIGPNGAGKTTMMDVVTGKTRPDSGSAWFGQTMDLTRMSEAEIARAGIGRKFQKPTVFERHTVFENLELALAGDRRARTSLFGRPAEAMRDRISDALRLVRLAGEADRPAGLLSHGQKQWLEIGMLLERTAELVRSLAGERSVLVVEHDMEFVATLGCKVTVLDEGAVLAEGTLDAVQRDPRVIEVYLGR